MTDIAMWSLLVGALLPPFIAILQQPSWSRPARSVATVVVCLLVGLVTSWLRGGWSVQGTTTTVLLVLVTALTTYQSFWKPTAVAGTIEAATSPADDSPALHAED